MTRAQWHALRRFGAWAIGGGLLAGGFAWWAHVSPGVGAGAQLAFTVAGVLLGLQLMRDTRRMERERLACEQKQLEILERAIAQTTAVAHQMMSNAREAVLIRRQVAELDVPKQPAEWLN
jgi:C4-dicarboxylate-specific signal transduction histidine kinase